MAESSKKVKPTPVPWWGWVLIVIGAALALPTLVSDVPFPALTSIAESLSSIGKNLWFFIREGLKGVGLIEG